MRRLCMLTVVSAFCLVLGGPASANIEESRFHATLRGFNEVPVNTSLGRARLELTISHDDSQISFRLEFANLTGDALVSHVHLGAVNTNGGVSFFFCGGGGKPACPTGTGILTVTGTVVAADVVGPTAQGVTAGDLADVIRAIRSGVAYANIHTAKFPAGEIRGQLVGRFAHDRDDD